MCCVLLQAVDFAVGANVTNRASPASQRRRRFQSSETFGCVCVL